MNAKASSETDSSVTSLPSLNSVMQSAVVLPVPMARPHVGTQTPGTKVKMLKTIQWTARPHVGTQTPGTKVKMLKTIQRATRPHEGTQTPGTEVTMLKMIQVTKSAM